MEFKSSNNNFDLWRSLAVSLALHAWLLSQATPQAVSRAGLPLTATLRQSGAEAVAASFSAEPQPPAAVLADAHREAQAKPPESAGAAPLMPSLAARSVPSDRPPGAAPEAGAGPDEEGMRQYRLSLAAATRRFKHYPASALDRGLWGRAEVRIAVAANGMAQPPQLASSSGHELLDEAAIDMIGRAVQATSLPRQLRGQAFAFLLPVLFEIDGE